MDRGDRLRGPARGNLLRSQASPTAHPVDPGVEPLGVGIVHNPALSDLLRSDPDVVDYLSVTPETFWVDSEDGSGAARFAEIASLVGVLDDFARHRPVVAHGIGLSIASAGPLDDGLLDQIARWRDRYGLRWYSEHLSYTTVSLAAGLDRRIGLGLPPPYDHDVLDLLCERVATVVDRVGAPFALENGVTYTDLPDEDMTEPAFLNALVERTGCHVLLDLHNLHTNAVNGMCDAAEYLDELDLGAVVEIHVAGGHEVNGFHVDGHTGRCPPEVWELLAAVVPRCPNLRGVTFEFHEGRYADLGEAGVREELATARAIWEAGRCR